MSNWITSYAAYLNTCIGVAVAAPVYPPINSYKTPNTNGIAPTGATGPKATQALAIAKSKLGQSEAANSSQLQAFLGVNPKSTYWCAYFVSACFGGKSALGAKKAWCWIFRTGLKARANLNPKAAPSLNPAISSFLTEVKTKPRATLAL